MQLFWLCLFFYTRSPTFWNEIVKKSMARNSISKIKQTILFLSRKICLHKYERFPAKFCRIWTLRFCDKSDKWFGGGAAPLLKCHRASANTSHLLKFSVRKMAKEKHQCKNDDRNFSNYSCPLIPFSILSCRVLWQSVEDMISHGIDKQA